MTKLKKITSVVLSLLLLVSNTPTKVEASTSGNGKNFVFECGGGTNLGDYLDGHNGTDHYPDVYKDWGTNGDVTQKYYDAVAKRVDSIRIPVSFINHVDSNYNIDKDWLNKVESNVDMALKAKLNVIIDLHNDCGNGDGYAFYLNDGKFRTYYKKIWKQVANRFKNKSYSLAFENMNEATAKGINYGGNYNDKGYYSKLCHDYAQDFINIVRKSGGKNAKRCLLLQPYGGLPDAYSVNGLMYGFMKGSTEQQKHSNNYFGTLLEDPAGTGYLALSVHMYGSDCINSTWGLKKEWWGCNGGQINGKNVVWGDYIYGALQMSGYGKKGNYPVVFTETTPTGNVYATDADLEAYGKTVKTISEINNGAGAVFLWDNGKGPNSTGGQKDGYMNRLYNVGKDNGGDRVLKTVESNSSVG